MLKQRILTVAVLLPLFLAALFLLPNLYWSVLLTVLLGVAAHEWGRLAGLHASGRLAYAAALSLAGLVILIAEAHGRLGAGFIYSIPGRFLYAFCITFWLAIAPVWLYYRWETRDPWLLGLIGLVVLLPFWSALAWMQLDPGRLLMALSVVWVADTAAYFCGRKWGRHRLAARISPGKTVEGAAGALVAVSVYWTALCLLLPRFEGQYKSGLALVLILTVVSVLGDLFESWMKRLAGMKDSGTLLPGHGGVLDRVDALSSAVPLAALYFAYPVLRLS